MRATGQEAFGCVPGQTVNTRGVVLDPPHHLRGSHVPQLGEERGKKVMRYIHTVSGRGITCISALLVPRARYLPVLFQAKEETYSLEDTLNWSMAPLALLRR